MIIDIIRLLTTVILTQIFLRSLQNEALNSVNGLEIWPNTSNFTLLSNAPEDRRILLCRANVPILWYFKNYDGELQIKKNSSIAVFPKDNNRSIHISLLSLRKATYLDSGNYFCSTSTESKYFKEIYVFVPHETYLLAMPEDFKLLYDISKNDTVIWSFRPASLDVNVTITGTEIDNMECYQENVFQCNNGRCIFFEEVCDGINSCGDYSDEDQQLCENLLCPPDRTFRCNNSVCIHEYYVCNRQNNCGDNSDEEQQMCKNKICPPERPFRCKNNFCMSENFVCDDTVHRYCGDSGDEDPQMCKNRKCPPERSFRCNNSSCISEHYVCDGRNTCGDNSDEHQQMCKNKTCPPNRSFRCNNNVCISEYNVCDGQNDCGDNSDDEQTMCEKKSCPSTRSFRCNNSVCISENYVCDGQNDCGDNSDEDQQKCNNTFCPPGRSFRCNNNACISEYNVCDGKNDCDDNSDEDRQICKNKLCPPNKSFKCNNSKCIPEGYVCDGQNNCNDKSDEDQDICKNKICPPNRSFRCNNSVCISENYVCDGDNDCGDMSDEDQDRCKKQKLCPPGDSFKCNNNECIFEKYVCDGRNDCGDNSDEDHQICKNKTCPLNRSFKCNNSACISENYVCDGDNDCGDNSDEDQTICKNKLCPPDRPFHCNNSTCISKFNVCDGYNDCVDKSDEDEQMCKNRLCPPNRSFMCNNGICISEEFVCDGANDCGDNSDDDQEMCKKKSCPSNRSFRCNNSICISERNVCDGNNDCGDNSDDDQEMCKNRICPPDRSFRCNNSKCIPDEFVCNRKYDCVDSSDEQRQMCKMKFITSRFIFVEKKGFELNVSIFTSIYDIVIVGSKINITDIRQIHNPLESWLHIDDSSSDHVFLGQNVTLNCYLEHKISPVYLLKWIVPATLKNKTQHLTVGNYTGRNVLLNIQDVSSKDLGVYKCTAMMKNGRNFSKTYNLNAYSPDINYLNLKFKDGIIKKIRPAGHESVQWVIQISSNQNTNYEWIVHNGKLIETKFEKKCIKNNNCSSELILKNLRLSDSGIYRLAAYTRSISKETEVTLFVEEKPKVIFINGLNFTRPYYEIGKNYTFEFYISGYPLPNVTWALKNCTNYPKCEESRVETNKIKYEKIEVSTTIIKLIITMNITNSVTLLCYASNSLGNSTKRYTILVIDASNDLEVKGSHSDRIVKGDNITIVCAASVYEYMKDIKWNYRNLSRTQQNVNIVNEITKWSFQSKLMITNISNNFNGYFYCTVKKIPPSNNVPSVLEIKSIAVKVKDPSEPVINNSTNTNNSIEEEQRFGVLLFCIMLTLLLIILIVVRAIIIKREKTIRNALALIKKNKSEKNDVTDVFLNMGIPFRLNFPSDNLKLGKRLGSGQFGVVFKAKAIGLNEETTATDVAVKTINPNTDCDCIKILESELKIMTKIGYHLNIVNLLGVCVGTPETIDKKLMVIVEYCHYGNVHQYILKHRNCFTDQFSSDGFTHSETDLKPDCVIVNNSESAVCSIHHGDSTIVNIESLCTSDLLSWSFQVAKAMEFLASKKILHGDLATRNILLAEANIVKLCDFGLARIMSDDEIYQKKSKKSLLPFKWMAIESIRDRVFSTRSDVWSFGIVLWEMFSLSATPYPDLQLFDLYNKLIDGYRLEEPRCANTQVYSIMLDCWETEPIKRPTFTDLAKRLGNILQDVTKTDYAEVTDHYKTTNIETLPSTSNGNQCTSPTYSKCPIIAEIHEESPNYSTGHSVNHI